MREIYEPFDNAEEVWFWFCRSLDARGDGCVPKATIRASAAASKSATFRGLKRMRARGEITNRCLRVMSKWGMLGTPPYYDGRAKRSEIRLWEYGIGIFDFYLKTKGIL